MHGADLRKAELRGANLRDAILTDAKLSEADLGSANLSEADLIGADLCLANLRGSMLSKAKPPHRALVESYDRFGPAGVSFAESSARVDRSDCNCVVSHAALDCAAASPH